MLRHFAEPRAAHGGIAAEGALNLLGRPETDPLVILVREAVQNSWDARSTSREPVHVELGLFELNQRQRRALTDEVFPDLPPHGLFPRGAAATTELADALEDTPLQILTVTDRGTTGLGGPIRADTPADPAQSTDFVDLVFNIGQPRDSTFGGGTYGFGKTISYLVSRCRTVIIHTRTMDHGLPQHRLIAQAIGQQYCYQRRNYTGRHWWGRVRDTGAVQPLTGRVAEALAGALGLPSFEGGTGTTIAIVAPDLGDRSPEQAMTFLAEALTWNFWPKMMGEGHRRPSMHFAVSCNGEPTPVPDPARTPPLHAYMQALEAVRSCESGRHRPTDYPTFHIHEIRSQRPRALLGCWRCRRCPARLDQRQTRATTSGAYFGRRPRSPVPRGMSRSCDEPNWSSSTARVRHWPTVLWNGSASSKPRSTPTRHSPRPSRQPTTTGGPPMSRIDG